MEEKRLREADGAAEWIRKSEELRRQIQALADQEAAIEQEVSAMVPKASENVDYLLEVAENADTESANRDFTKMAENMRILKDAFVEVDAILKKRPRAAAETDHDTAGSNVPPGSDADAR
jgi:uncharacterized coiled-coil DUF342 family protein